MADDVSGDPIIVYQPALSRSVRFSHRHYASIRWAINRIYTLHGNVIFAAHRGYEPAWMDDSGRTTASTLFTSDVSGCLGLLLAAARHYGLEHVTFARLATAFAPAGIVGDLRRLCRETGAALTLATGLPMGITPVVINRDFLEAATFLPGHVEMTDPVVILRTLIENSQKLAPNDPPFERVLDASLKYSFDTQELPASVEILCAEHQEVLSVLRGADRDAADGIALLRDWKQIELSRTRSMLQRKRLQTQKTMPGARRRVLYVSAASAFSGSEESLCTAIAAMPLPRDCHALVTLNGDFSDRLAAAGVRVHVTDFNFTNSTPEVLVRLDELLQSVDPDLVHLNGPSGFPLMAIAHMRGIPVVSHVRIASFAETAPILRGCDHLIAVSDYVKRCLIGSGMDPDRISVVYDGIDVQDLTARSCIQAEVRCKLGIPSDAFVVAMIARYVPNKRHDILLEAVRLLPFRAHLLLVGESHLDTSIEMSVLRKTREGSIDVTCLGFQPDIVPIHSAADVVVLCSEQEPLGTCILEAMALQKAVIVTDSGGTQELVRPLESGFVVKAGDPASLAAAIERLYREPPLRTRIGQLARTACLNNFSSKEAASRLEILYEQILIERKAVYATN